jgi:hypothetical protein
MGEYSWKQNHAQKASLKRGRSSTATLGPGTNTYPLLRLQSTAGNPVASRILPSREPGPDLDHSAASASSSKSEAQVRIQKKSANENESEIAVPPIVPEVLHSPGQPLDPALRGFMESRFGHDFSRVRIHSDTRAAESARVVNAIAYTGGYDVAFGQGRYEPASTEGRRLLAHELTHVVQQRAGAYPKDGVGEAGDAYERHADKVAGMVVEGRSAGPLLNAYGSAPAGGRATGSVVQRQADGHEFGDIYKMVPDATYVAGSSSRDIENRLKYGTGKGAAAKKPSPEELPGLFSKFVGMLRALDKIVTGKATQSWGMVIYGEGDGRDSPAAVASKGAKLWGSFDYAEFMKLINLILVAIPENSDYRKTIEDMRDEMDAKKVDNLAAFVLKAVQEIEEIKKDAGVGESDNKKGAAASESKQQTTQKPQIASDKPTTGLPAKPKRQLGQWVASDASGNTYIMIKYSDGSKRFVFGSIFGTRDINDPGPMDWKRVQ